MACRYLIKRSRKDKKSCFFEHSKKQEKLRVLVKNRKNHGFLPERQFIKIHKNRFAYFLSGFMKTFLGQKARKNLRNPKISKVFGGDKRDRTADLLNAIQALSQLSYTPKFSCAVRQLLYYSTCYGFVKGVFMFF